MRLPSSSALRALRVPSSRARRARRVALAIAVLGAWAGAAGVAACGRTGGGAGGGAPAVDGGGGAARGPTSSDDGAAAGGGASADLDEAPHTGSALAYARGADVLYVADEDHALLRSIGALADMPADAGAVSMQLARIRADAAAAQRWPSVETKLGARPANVVALGGGKLAVTVRDPGALVVLDAAGDPTHPKETLRVPLPADAWGLAVSADERLALVTSAWTHQVSLIDLAAGKKLWSVSVAREPRGVVFRRGAHGAYVSHLTSRAITRLDFAAAEGESPRVSTIDLPAAPLRARGAVEASLGYALVLSPDKRRLYAPRHALGALGDEAWFGTSAVDVLLTADDTPLCPPRATHDDAVLARSTGSYVESRMVDGDAGPYALAPLQRFAEPRAALYRRATDELLVLSEGTNAVARLRARAVDPALQADPAPVSFACAVPSGVALSPDERLLFVFCRSPYAVVRCDLGPAASAATGAWAACGAPLVVADDPLSPLAAKGRALFHDGHEGDVSGGVACAGCHPEGRDDGHVWHEIQTSAADFPVPDGVEPRVFTGSADVAGARGAPRQTPMLAGRVKPDGPYGWRAENPDLESRLQEGMHLHRWLAGTYDAATMSARADALVAFLRTGLVAPPREVRELTPEEARGKTIFESPEAACATCHAPATDFTDRVPHKLTPWPTAAGFDEEEGIGFKPPSLLFVGGTPPYYHDGSAKTLEELVEKNMDRMGKTQRLSPTDRAALVAYLRTL